jgi:hypothetical protein
MRKSSSKSDVFLIEAALLMAFVLLASAYIVSAAGDFNCSITAGGSCTNTKALYLKNDTGGYMNAHAQNVSAAATGWYSTSWNYRKSITINASQVNGTQTNFPVMVRLASDSDLAADAQDDGDDILFTNTSGTKLDHEIELFNGSTGELVAWVRMPTLVNTSDTTLYMYYGNSSVGSQQNRTGVWDTYYKGVWHLSDAGGTAADSLGVNNLTNEGSVNTTTGRIGMAASFNGSNDLYNDAPTGIDPAPNMTAEAWVRTPSDVSSYQYFLQLSDYSGHSTIVSIAFTNTGNHVYGLMFGTIYPSTPSLNSTEWHHVVFEYNVPYFSIYVDGNFDQTYNPGDYWFYGGRITIGALDRASLPFTGYVDEVKYSHTLRSAQWIATEYNNQKNGSTFLSLGGKESSYPYVICCNSNSSLSYACGEGVLLKLNATTNSHVQRGDYSGPAPVYGVSACLTTAPGYFNCTYVDDSCPANRECFVSMASSNASANNNTDAHVGPCNEYKRKVCCGVFNETVVTYVSPTPAANSRQTSNSVSINATVRVDAGSSADTCILEWKVGTNPAANETMQKIGTGSFVSCNATKATVDATNYTFKVYANDSGGNMANETARTFRENDEPAKVALDYPANQSHNTSRTPMFHWTVPSDADGDTLNYTINITCFGGCSDDNRIVSDIATNSYTPTTQMKYFGDDNYYYNWSIRAGDGYEFGSWSDVWKLTLDTNVSIIMLNSTIDFGVNRPPGYTDNTTDNSPYPFSIRNVGNCMTDVNISASDMLWDSVTAPSSYYRYKVDSLSGEGGAFNWSGSQTSWANVPQTNTTFVNNLNYTAGNSSFEVDINITVPGDEPPGTKSSTLLFAGEYHGPG